MPEAPSHSSNGRAVLLLIAGIPLTMILAATWLWYFVVEGDLDIVGTLGTANHGELLQPPRQVAEYRFLDDAGAPIEWSDMEPRWTMLMINTGADCDTACERRMYTTRQIHVALGREFNRVRRVMLTDHPADAVNVALPKPDTAGFSAAAPTDLRGFAAVAHEGMVLLQGESAVLDSLAAEAMADPAQWYLVDPGGWVMMRFTDDLSYKSVIKDMKFLLKNSGG